MARGKMPHETTHQPVVAPVPPWGVAVFESHHATDFRMDVSRHAWLEVFYVLEGSGVFELEGRPEPCTAGDVVVVSPGMGHRIRDDARHPLAMYGVRIRPDVWHNVPALGPLLPAGRVRRSRLISLRVRSEFRQLLFEQTLRRAGYEAMMVGGALGMLALLARSHSRPFAQPEEGAGPRSTLLQTVEAYVAELDHRFLEVTKMDNAVRHLGMSRRRFTDLFRRVTKTTWARYVRQLRIAHAKELLANTPKSILSIAFESGYEDLSSFYRAFQSETRCPPHRWRERRKRES